MRISDWSSDVCSSDLAAHRHALSARPDHHGGRPLRQGHPLAERRAGAGRRGRDRRLRRLHLRSEERRVGKSVSVRVDLGGRRIIKKKIYTTKHLINQQYTTTKQTMTLNDYP